MSIYQILRNPLRTSTEPQGSAEPRLRNSFNINYFFATVTPVIVTLHFNKKPTFLEVVLQ
jgi:hypothetical protein